MTGGLHEAGASLRDGGKTNLYLCGFYLVAKFKRDTEQQWEAV